MHEGLDDVRERVEVLLSAGGERRGALGLRGLGLGHPAVVHLNLHSRQSRRSSRPRRNTRKVRQIIRSLLELHEVRGRLIADGGAVQLLEDGHVVSKPFA